MAHGSRIIKRKASLIATLTALFMVLTSIPSYGTALPKKYDLRNVNGVSYMTSVKSQGAFDNCWAPAAIGAIESNIAKKGYGKWNLSELHLQYYTMKPHENPRAGLQGDYIDNSSGLNYMNVGGDYEFATKTVAAWYGPVHESVAKYPTGSKAPKKLAKSKAYRKTLFVPKNIDWVGSRYITRVKRNIMKYGAGTLGFMVHATRNMSTETYWNYDNNAYYLDKAGYTNGFNEKGGAIYGHEVVICGWDDNFSRNNFGGTKGAKPKKDGAWLCRNSWGTGKEIEECEDGYFWISYYDYYIANVTDSRDFVCFYDMIPRKEAADRVYQYDGIASPGYLNSLSNKGRMANVFKASYKQKLTGVGFFTLNNNVKYSIQLYKNPKSWSPCSGKKMLSKPVTGKITYQGFHTVDLPKKVKMKKGDRFSVVITLKSAKGKVHFATDSTYYDPDPGLYFRSGAKQGQSFINRGDGWLDVSSKKVMFEPCNVRVKAYADKIK